MYTGAERVGNLDLRQLRCVLAVAELGSVRRASAQIGIPVRALDRELARVDRTLRTPMFERQPRRIRPTPAGAEVARIARTVLEGQLVEQQELTPEGASLRVGWLDFGRGQAVQRAAISEFRARNPGVPLHLVPSLFGDQPQDIADGVLDVGFFSGPRPSVAGVAVELFLPETVSCALLPLGYPVENAAALAVSDLSGLPFHSLRTDYAPEIMEGVHESVARAGWRGRQTTGSSRPSEVITAVACGAGWAPAPSGLIGWAPPGVRVVPLADGPLMGIDLHVMWRDENPLAREFVRLVYELREVIDETPPPAPAAGVRVETGYGALLAQRYAERARVARDLHDTLLQDVSGSELQLEALRRRLPSSLEHEGRELLRVVERLGRAVRTGREVLQNLQPPRTRARDLASALREAAEVAGTGAVEFRLRTGGTPRELRASVEDAAARIGAEAVSNAFRHADASRITASLAYWDDLFRLRVADNGVGIERAIVEAGERKGHFGLPLMKERAAAAGGTLSVRRTRSGTAVELVVPGYMAFAM